MKKIFFCCLLAASILSCKKTENKTVSEINTEIKKDSIVLEKMSISEIADSLKKSDYSKEFAKYSDEIVNKVAEKMSYTLTMDESGETEYLKEIMGFENNIISLYWETCGTGGCMQHQKLQIKGNDVIDLGNGFDKLSETEMTRLDNEITKKNKEFSHISGRNEADIKLIEGGNYLISFQGLTQDDGEATGGSLEISYETKDLKTFLTSTLKVVAKKIN